MKSVAEGVLVNRNPIGLDELTEQERSVVQCRDFNQLTLDETAKVLKLTTNQVRYRIEKVRKKMRIKLAELASNR